MNALNRRREELEHQYNLTDRALSGTQPDAKGFVYRMVLSGLMEALTP